MSIHHCPCSSSFWVQRKLVFRPWASVSYHGLHDSYYTYNINNLSRILTHNPIMGGSSYSPPPSRHRRGTHDPVPQVDAELPPPNTYNEFKQQKDPRAPWIRPAGESGRSGFHPIHFAHISFKSTSRASLVCNFLWPVVPAAIAVRYALPDHHVLIFTLSYIAMVPCANMIGFAGQELARKLPHVWGVLVEITYVSIYSELFAMC